MPLEWLDIMSMYMYSKTCLQMSPSREATPLKKNCTIYLHHHLFNQMYPYRGRNKEKYSDGPQNHLDFDWSDPSEVLYVAGEWIKSPQSGGSVDSICKQNVKIGCLESNFEPICMPHYCFAFILFIFSVQNILSHFPVKVKGSLRTDRLLSVPYWAIVRCSEK